MLSAGACRQNPFRLGTDKSGRCRNQMEPVGIDVESAQPILREFFAKSRGRGNKTHQNTDGSAVTDHP